jgi:hypothetical protein
VATTKTYDMGGTYRDEFVKYFLEIGGGTDDQVVFKGQYWEARVGSDILKPMGSLKINHVMVTFRVEEEKFDEFLARFHQRFLRAGG